MPNRMNVDRDDKGQIYYEYMVSDTDAPTMNGTVVRLNPADILHIPGMGFDGLNEMSRTCSARYIKDDELWNITFSVFADEDDFTRRTDHIDLYDDHVSFITKDGRRIERSREPGRRRKANAGK